MSGFAPFDALAAGLLPLLPAGDDGAHDRAHLGRVWANARRIAAVEGGDRELLAAAVLLHDCVTVEKNSPRRSAASRLAAARAEILAGLSWPKARIALVADAIAAHSFSAGIVPESLEAKILQDADRLDAIGHIGIARCFYTAGRMGSALYHPDDPAAAARPLDDRSYALDHFRAKLLRLADGFQTATGARLAAERTRVLAAFVAGFEAELR